MKTELYALSEQLGKILLERHLRLVTAESCTGGLIAESIVTIAGSSAYFDSGFVTYSNESKMAELGVKSNTLAQFGAVSVEVAGEMVEGALERCKGRAEVAIAVTGIAGPGGGTPEKPVGTVCFAWKIAGSPTKVERRNFVGNRDNIRFQAAYYALKILESVLR